MSVAYFIMSIEGILILYSLLQLAKQSFKFLWKKDRLLLWHFVLLFFSIIFRIISCILPMIDDLAALDQEKTANTAELIRNFCAYTAINLFFLACSLNLLKWLNLIFFLHFKANFQEDKYEKQKQKNKISLLTA